MTSLAHTVDKVACGLPYDTRPVLCTKKLKNNTKGSKRACQPPVQQPEPGVLNTSNMNIIYSV